MTVHTYVQTYQMEAAQVAAKFTGLNINYQVLIKYRLR
jgi:hypothetical protein